MYAILSPFHLYCAICVVFCGKKAGGATATEPRLSSAQEGLQRLPWQENGYLSWEYDGHKINYVDEGDKNKVYLTTRSLIEMLSIRNNEELFVNSSMGTKLIRTWSRKRRMMRVSQNEPPRL